jgi:hypothetical protein
MCDGRQRRRNGWIGIEEWSIESIVIHLGNVRGWGLVENLVIFELLEISNPMQEWKRWSCGRDRMDMNCW